MRNQNDFFDSLYNPIEKLSVVDWAEKYRELSTEVSISNPGRMSYGITPYLKKIANSVMSDNVAQIIAVMKGSQIGWSIGGIFSIMGWKISQHPGNMLFITENDDKIKEQMQGAISQMINSSGISHLVGSHNLREYREAGNRRNAGTGDTVKGLEFEGGKLYTYSGQKIGSLSSISIHTGLYDEVERWKGVYKKSGAFMGLVEPRHRSAGSDRKIFLGSTPEVKQTSNIEPLYLLGDQQKYHIPCTCGALIDLHWTIDVDGEHAGIHYERDKNGKYIENSAAYICQSCGKLLKEVHKFDMYEEEHYAYQNRNKNAEDYDSFKTDMICKWLPTAEPESFIHESYHISSLYAPMGFYSWNDLARKWCSIHPIDAPIKVRELQTFYNQELGFTWEERARDLKGSHLRKNRRYYDPGTIPDVMCEDDGNGPIVAITVAIDINGEMGEKYSDGNDDVRIDYEAVAWCERGEDDYVVSYSIDQGSIGTFKRTREKTEGDKKNEDSRVKWTLRHGHENNVWDEFDKEVLFRDWETESGKHRRIMLCGVDTGNFTSFANEYVDKHDLCVGLKGGSEDGYTKFRNNDKSLVKKGTKSKLYIVQGNLVKNLLADEIDQSWTDENDIKQPYGFMNFPMNVDGKYEYKTYFKEYEGEHKIMEIAAGGGAVGFKWKKKHSSSPNHFFDCRVYNIALQQILMEYRCKMAVPKMDVSWTNYCVLVNAYRKYSNMTK